ncbi:hypothetical protein FHG87_001245 [Trinorchestia longiramus]|nr:hypothetical protein FHG87_001245 [Trinorchestia longiramus]
MAEGMPPPLPPKQKSGAPSGFRSSMNNNEATQHRYSREDVARALQEEELAFQRIKQQKDQLQRNLRPSRIDVSRSFSVGANDCAKPQYGSSSLSATPASTPASITPPPVMPRHLRNSSAANTVTTSKSVDETEDLMSFKSPEKPKNDILDMLQNLNANHQRAVVAVSSSAMGSSMQGYQMQQQLPALTSSAFTAFNVPGTATAYPNRNVTLLNNQPINSNIMASAAPPIPSRNPVFIPNRISFFANQMYPSSCSTTPSPVTAANSLVSSYTSGNAQAQSINSLSFKFNGDSQSTPFAYKPNIPLNIPPKAPTLSEVSTVSVGSMTAPRLSSVSTTSTVPTSTSNNTPVLAKIPPIKQKRTGRRNEDLIDFGSSPSRVSSSRPENVDSLLFDFDPLVSRSNEQQNSKHSTARSSGHSTATNGDDAFSVKVQGVVVLSYEASEMLRYKEKNILQSTGEDDETSNYYEHVDPFEYMRPDGSCRSDPVYDAYDGLRSPTGMLGDTFDIPPPLPPRSPTPEVVAAVTSAASVTTNASAVTTNAAAVTTNAAAVTTNAAAVITNAAAVITNAAAVITTAAAVSTTAAAVTTTAKEASAHKHQLSWFWMCDGHGGRQQTEGPQKCHLHEPPSAGGHQEKKKLLLKPTTCLVHKRFYNPDNQAFSSRAVPRFTSGFDFKTQSTKQQIIKSRSGTAGHRFG